jgi:hypothetical protein
MMRKDIRIYPSSELLASEVREALVRLLPVEFKSCTNFDECGEGDAVVDLLGNAQSLTECSKLKQPFFHVRNSSIGPRLESFGEPVQFGSSPYLDKRLRGRKIAHQSVSGLSAVQLEPGDEVLASYGSTPVWVRRKTVNGSGQIVSASLPVLVGKEKPFDYLNGYHFIQLLPLLHFLREITADIGWVQPPVRACFMFDDPNLHWPSYGCLSYRKLIEYARKDRFHVTFATVPLDAWCLHAGAVKLFKESPAQLSLLIHGNNHTREELGQPRTRDWQLQLLAQSLQRIERLERLTGLSVDRVIVPPHEALAEEVLAAMFSLGFEGVSLAPWSLRYWNQTRDWSCVFGLEIAEMTHGGFPVLARYKLSEKSEGPAVISALLGQPIVLAEHHEAAADGLDLLSCVAKQVNSVGDVAWCSTGTMLRSNYLTRLENATLCVKPYASRIVLVVPSNVHSVMLVAPDRGEQKVPVDQFNWFRKREGAGTPMIQIPFGEPFTVVPGETVEMVSTNLGAIDYRDVEKPVFSPWFLSRRMLCEARDRLVALKPRPRKA